MTSIVAIKISTDTAQKAARSVSWPVCAVVFFFGNALLWSDRSNFSVVAAVWAKDYNWSPSRLGLMFSAFSLGYALLQPFGGWLVDKLGSRRSFALTVAGSSFCVLLTPLAPTVLWLTLTFRMMLGVFEAPYISNMVAALATAVPSDARRGRYTAFLQSGAKLGPAAGVFLSGAFLSFFGSPIAIFFIFGGLGLVFAGIWWLYVRRLEDPMPSEAEAQTPEAVERASQPLVPYIKLLTCWRLLPLYVGYFASPYIQYIFLSWLPQYLSHYRHMSISDASFASALPYIVAFVGGIAGGFMMDWLAAKGWRKNGIHRKFVSGIGALMYVCSMLIAVNSSSNTVIVAMICIANTGMAFYAYAYWAIITDMTSRQGGALSGLMNSIGFLGGIISPLITGVIAEATGDFVAPLELAVAVVAVCSLTGIFVLKIRPISELVR